MNDTIALVLLPSATLAIKTHSKFEISVKHSNILFLQKLSNLFPSKLAIKDKPKLLPTK